MLPAVSSSQRPRFPFLSKCLFVVVLAITLIAGLDPKGYHFRNEVTWLKNEPGLQFGRYGRAHTEPFVTPAIAEQLNAHGFTVEFATTLADLANGAFRILATFHSGDDGSQLLIGQWRQTIVAMNGDDYNHTRKFPRITADMPTPDARPALITITTGPAGTSLYINGKREAIRGGLHLIMPSSPVSARLTLGASVHASNPWEGDLRGFALYARPMTRSEVTKNYLHWAVQKSFAFAATDSPLLLYPFTERTGAVAKSEGELQANLILPSHLWALGRRALAPLSQHTGQSRSDYEDTVINLLGFIPFGFTFALSLGAAVPNRANKIILTTLAGLLLSLLIELAQAWLPSRDSSMHDLLLNGAGAFLGSSILVMIPRRR